MEYGGPFWPLSDLEDVETNEYPIVGSFALAQYDGSYHYHCTTVTMEDRLTKNFADLTIPASVKPSFTRPSNKQPN